MSTPNFSPADIAAAVGKKFAPTAEQAKVIEGGLGPKLVTAGAGAGKTETMASRVVSLVANGLVRPEQVLGLTFTRKAAQQLEQRIRKSLIQLRDTGLFAPGSEVAKSLESIAPKVSTYDSFAGELVREYGLYLPVEPSARLITDAERFAIAHEIVSNYEGAMTTKTSVATVAQTVLKLADSMGNVLMDADDIREHARVMLSDATELPKARKSGPEFSQELQKILDVQQIRVEYLELVAAVQAEQHAQGVVSFGEQMSFAARVADANPGIGTIQRQRYRVVMLDEYQDTSHSQRVLLRSLFGGAPHPNLSVTAVGDPMQAIYGWRGATTENLNAFIRDFPLDDTTAAPQDQLTVSWRNPSRVLDLANVVADDIFAGANPRPVDRLSARPGAEAGDVKLGYFETLELEREFVAQHMRAIYDQTQENKEPLSAAVLVRTNRHAAEIGRHLEAHGVPFEIVGLGGLLWEPEIQDLVAIATMLVRPQDSASALRILAGPLCGLGMSDIVALHKRVENMTGASDERVVYTPGDDPLEHLRAQLQQQVDNATTKRPEQILGLADAVADMGEAERYTEEGRGRIEKLASKLRHLRSYSLGKSLPDLFADIESIFNLRTEVLARDRAGGATHLDKFADIVASYQGDTLGGLLDYLELAREHEDGLDPGEVPAVDDRVLVLTVHKSKGLEWEHVSVLHADSSTYGAKANSFITKVEQVPSEDDVIEPEPQYDKNGDEKPITRTDYGKAAKALERQYKDANAEESARLFYVAMTRTEKSLTVTGGGTNAHKAGHGSKKGPYVYLEMLAEKFPDLVVEWNVPEDPADEAADISADSGQFPFLQPTPAALLGAQLVNAAKENLPEHQSGEEFGLWESDATALIEEHRALTTPVVEVTMPSELTASDVVSLHTDPEEFARRRRRPVPFKPNSYAKRGTAFHTWLEDRFGMEALLEEDELPGTGEIPVADVEALKEKFLESEWANRTPHAVEAGFRFSAGGQILNGRMDAVFKQPDGSWFVVDWKTGRPPKGKDMESAALQLAIYREAWRRIVADGQPIRAAFHYVSDNFSFEPRNLPDGEELARLLSTVTD
ncbi:ATP-dependent helicase [Corynebacterium casei]|uniref:ATP-dependent helicase n=1 Tax=Corynebacterium casei TaxID=160386 RepID=UPI003F9178FC